MWCNGVWPAAGTHLPPQVRSLVTQQAAAAFHSLRATVAAPSEHFQSLPLTDICHTFFARPRFAEALHSYIRHTSVPILLSAVVIGFTFLLLLLRLNSPVFALSSSCGD
jgi:hypothetical protein